MERAILVIVLIVALVGVVGLFSSYDFGSSDALPSPTGYAVAEQAPTCGQCAGYAPVCGQLNNRFLTFTNACEAECSGASVVADYPCERA